MLKLSDLANRQDFALGALRVSPSRREIAGPAGEVHVEPIVMQVFLVLADAKGEVVTRNRLFDECWGGVNVGDDSLNRAITMVRRIAVETAPGAFEIENIPRTGYRLVTEQLPVRKRAARLARERSPLVMGAIGMGLVTAAAVAFLLVPPTPRIPTVMLITERNNQFSNDLAEGIASAAIKNPAFQNGRFKLLNEPDSDNGDPDFVLKVDGIDGATREAKLTLSGADRSVLWGWSDRRPRDLSPMLQQQAGGIAAAVLGCAAETRADPGKSPDQETVKLYVDSCAKFYLWAGAELSLLAEAFDRVVAKAPQLRGAWSRLFMSKAEIIEGASPQAGMVDSLRRNIAAARALKIDVPETYIADAAVLPLNARFERLKLYDAGLARYPNSQTLLLTKSWQLRSVGRMFEAASTAYRAYQLDPRSPLTSTEYANSLMHAGQVDAARGILDKAAQIAPDALNVRYSRSVLEMRYGDPHWWFAAVRNGNAVASTEWVSFANARIDPTEANIDRAIRDLSAIYRADPLSIGLLAQALGAFGRTEEAIQLLLSYQYGKDSGDGAEMLFRAPLKEVRRDPRFIRIAEIFEITDYWLRSGHWPDFCSDATLPYDCKAEVAKLRAPSRGTS